MSAVVVPKVRKLDAPVLLPAFLLPQHRALPRTPVQHHNLKKITVYVAKPVDAAAKKPRKKRDPTTKKQSDNKSTAITTTPDAKDAVPKPRKPRAAPGTATTKRKSKNAINPDDNLPSTQLSGQSKITDSLDPASNVNLPPPPESPFIESTNPRSSGQNYDPVRSSTIESRSFPPTPSHQILRSSTPPRPSNFGSASNSPSISSLIDPPQQMKRDNEYKPLSPPPKRQRLTPPDSASTPPITSLQDIPRHGPVDRAVVRQEKRDTVNHVSNPQPVLGSAATPMEIDDTAPLAKPAPVKRKSTTTSGTSTPANGVKPSRQKEASISVGGGNGLLSTEMFGGGPESSGPEKAAPTVILDVPLNGEYNKYINFARLAEERYGFNALYPRLAAQRDRLARVAAAGAALEKDIKNGSGISGDEMSVDLSDGEGAGDDSNVEMGGIGLIERDVLGGGTPAEGSDGTVRKRKKRVMKEDQYDKDDPFVDDTEMAWEEQAAASKDGFFVYSGPLVPEGEKPNVERADGTTKRGRGSGRGRGGSTRGSRGGATRGRGGATGPRKPRMTKAARETMDQEKVQRESLAMLAAKPTTYPA
ncbi:hypothetical protein G7Y79_00003g009000 [Physcia stellaris]|nr:hypothetical protein G7Y79_00003g009000 [Physcia stellaris]